jgi:hypothetical protein
MHESVLYFYQGQSGMVARAIAGVELGIELDTQ